MTIELGLDPNPVRRASIPVGVRLTGPLRAVAAGCAADLYHDGASIRAIAGELKRGYTTVHRLLAEAGVRMRSRGGRRPKPHLGARAA